MICSASTAAGPSKISNLPVVMITRALADKLLEAAGQPKLSALEAEIDDDLKPRSRPLEGWTLNADVTIDRTPIETKNVVGVLEGLGPLADETVVIGAHYDHLGRGGSGSLGVLFECDSQRRRRQRLGYGHGAGDGPPAGSTTRPPAPPRGVHRLLGRRARTAGIRTLCESSALPAQPDDDHGQLRHGRPPE